MNKRGSTKIILIILGIIVAIVIIFLILKNTVSFSPTPTEGSPTNPSKLSSSSYTYCRDSDRTTQYPDGINPFLRGTASNDGNSATDFCSTYLTEYYCATNRSIIQTYINCATYGNYICQNGACVNQTNQTHLECVSNTCTVVTGAGTNQCSSAGQSCGNQTNQTYLLTVSRTGSGTGTVTSNPAGINCGADCSENYVSGTSVALFATPNSGSMFNGWSGACSGTGACNVVMSTNRNVIANFGINSTNTSLPDLTIISLTRTYFAVNQSNQTFYNLTLRATVRNIGTANAGVSNTRFTLTSFQPRYIFTPSLAPSQSVNLTSNYLVTARTYNATAFADINNTVAESNENNNNRATSFSVP